MVTDEGTDPEQQAMIAALLVVLESLNPAERRGADAVAGQLATFQRMATASTTRPARREHRWPLPIR